MQKFLNNLIFRIVQDSSVSNTSHHPQFGEDGKLETCWLQAYLYVFWKKLEEKVGSVAKFGNWVSHRSVGCTHKQDPHLQGTNEMLKSTRKYFTQDASSYVTKKLWAVL